MALDSSHSRPLNMLFVPHLDTSHVIPIFEAARLFAARGQHAAFIATPTIASALRGTVDRDTAAGHHISLRILPPPTSEDGRPIEDLVAFNSMEEAINIYRALIRFRQKIDELIVADPPDCIVADLFPFAASAGADLDVPLLLFSVGSSFLHAVEDALERPDCPHRDMESDYEPFVVPGLPHRITLTRAQLMSRVIDPDAFARLRSEMKHFQQKSHGILINSFDGLEPGYIEHNYKVSGTKSFNIGPVALMHRNKTEKAERVFSTAGGEHECLRWLDSKKPNSVVYVCFGSRCAFPDEQLTEIARGLDDSGHSFLWVVRGRDDPGDRKWLPEGFEERTKERGMIIRGWAPQVLILDHPALGGFLTHCGWGSVTEGASAGVPMITWPVHSEQFYNEKLVTQVLGIGVEGGSKEINRTFNMEKVVIEGTKIAKAVRRLMDGGDEAESMRRRAKELSKMAKIAVAEGGSSHRNLTAMIDELRRLRDQKAHLPATPAT